MEIDLVHSQRYPMVWFSLNLYILCCPSQQQRQRSFSLFSFACFSWLGKLGRLNCVCIGTKWQHCRYTWSTTTVQDFKDLRSATLWFQSQHHGWIYVWPGATCLVFRFQFYYFSNGNKSVSSLEMVVWI